MGKNKVRLNMFGTDYVISSDESEEYIRTVAEEVEKRIQYNMQGNSRISVMMSAVLAALEYCDEAYKSKQSADNLRSQIKDYLEDSAQARLDLETARREVDRLTAENRVLTTRIAEMEQAAQVRQVLPGRTVAPSSPVSYPVPVPSELPKQTRMYPGSQTADSEAEDEVVDYFNGGQA